MTIDDDFIAQVEDELGMGHGAWDMVKAEDTCRAVLKVAETKLATERKQVHGYMRDRLELIREEIGNFKGDQCLTGILWHVLEELEMLRGQNDESLRVEREMAGAGRREGQQR